MLLSHQLKHDYLVSLQFEMEDQNLINLTEQDSSRTAVPAIMEVHLFEERDACIRIVEVMKFFKVYLYNNEAIP